MSEEIVDQEEKKVRVVIIKNNLKYRIKGFKDGRSFVPKVGEQIDLPKSIARKEVESKNVRLLMEEERELVKKKKKASK